MSKPNWDHIKNEWETSKITLAALAEKHDIKLGTLKSRKSREKWSRGATKKDATKTNKVATVKKKDASPKKNIEKETEPVIENKELTDKQRLFCIYYTKYFNATKAYQKAYESEYTTAMVNGHRLLRNAKISAEIERIKEEQANELKLGVRDILQKYIDIAFADITDFTTFGKKEVPVMTEMGPLLDDEGNEVTKEINYVDFNDSLEVDGTIITEVKQGRDGISVKLADKMKALEMLSKYFDLLSENDKKRLQEEKLKAETQKAKAEAERISKEHDEESEEIIIVDEWSDNDD